MSDGPEPHTGADLLHLLDAAELRIVEAPNELSPAMATDIRSILALVEAHTPLGAPLHTQLDNVRKWIGALEDHAAHARFGGREHLRNHVLMQLRLAHGALEDYLRRNTEPRA